MAQEPFLINPPKKLFRKRRRNPVGETLVTIGGNPMDRNPWYGDSGGHRLAALMRWGILPHGHVKRYRRRGRPKLHYKVSHRKKHYKKAKHHKVKHHKKYYKSKRKYSPGQLSFYGKYGGFGAYRPGRKPYSVSANVGRRLSVMRRRKKSYHNAWFDHRILHKRAALKGWRRRKRGHRHNPVRYRHRGRRRNPAFDLSRFTGGIMDVRSWVPLAVTGGLSAVTGAVVPQMIGVMNPWAKLGAQLVVAVGGGMVVEQVVDKRHGQAWMIVGVSMVGYQLLKQFILVPYFPQFAVGLGAYNDYMLRDTSQEVGAFPQEMSAFPHEMSAYPGVGEPDGDMVGAYPYDGSGY